MNALTSLSPKPRFDLQKKESCPLPLIESMMKGFESLDSFFAKHPLNPEQQQKLDAVVKGINHYKEYFRRTNGIFEKRRKIAKEDLGRYRGYRLRARSSEHLIGKSGYYLSRNDICEFEKKGVLGPYKLLSKRDAQTLYQYAQKMHDNDWGGKILIGDEVAAAMKKNDTWSINYSGFYQALRHKPFWDVLASKEIAERLASLLGENVICWRSQFFEKKPQQVGTFWHQTATFRESSEKQKLIPTTIIDEGIVQLTAWIALTDVTIKTGCMRMLPGSFADGRLERMLYDIIENPLLYALEKDEVSTERITRALLFTPGNFFKAQLAFDIAVEEIEDLFSSATSVMDLEMEAGDFIIFTSLNVHASYPNSTVDKTRLAFAGRFTNNDVKVYSNFESDHFPTPEGNVRVPIEQFGCIQINGVDRHHFNNIIPYPWS